MNNKRIPEEFEGYARICSYMIGTHFKGRTNADLEKILVSLINKQNRIIDSNIIEELMLARMIESFIDGIRGKKPPAV